MTGRSTVVDPVAGTSGRIERAIGTSPGRGRGGPTVWDRAGGAPGVVFGLVTAVAIVAAIDASTRVSFGLFMITAMAWFAIALVWLVRFGIGAARTRLRMPAAHWARWLVVPLAMGVAFALMSMGTLFDARFELSRPSLERMAADVMAGGSLERGWVGLYEVRHVQRAPEGVRFVIDSGFPGPLGFAWLPDRDPTRLDDVPWCCATYEPMGGGWWLWYETVSD